ncbi:MAG: hypothetical protein EPN46_02405 [Candidimonas sp.]|nr:MAG: hypothetical protein EPN77_05285 [Candidimonas sp.]TAM22296.1 MAG: hypothetical protein EPN62_12255 [Candidimonas sp.]TAM80184.1 MAG: hypothetical protein EPN46_02405 [Candidimonas sp.]
MATKDINLAELANFGPIINDEEVERIENIATSQGIGQGRRLVLINLSRGADTISNISITAPGAFAEIIEVMEDYQRHVKHLSEMVDAAMLRVRIADCREA